MSKRRGSNTLTHNYGGGGGTAECHRLRGVQRLFGQNLKGVHNFEFYCIFVIKNVPGDAVLFPPHPCASVVSPFILLYLLNSC